ncbi:protein FAM133-like isoform X3 [Branchiostoma floridae]|uniref:Protein FAM133-like isoform X3 n=1 Tax=Branchiostoma floridae TaxID=7739 RepID=A0A9J7KJP2_BRAFL|nr:protein FAM133-like isoform X3 [Branchiostoma floridae]
MGKRDTRFSYVNPIAMARARGPRPGDGPTIQDYLNRPRPSWEELKQLKEQKSKKGSSSLAAWEEQMNEKFREDLKKHRDKVQASQEGQGSSSSSLSHKKKKEKKKSKKKKRSRSPSHSSSSSCDSSPDSDSETEEEKKEHSKRREKRKKKKDKKKKKHRTDEPGTDNTDDEDKVSESTFLRLLSSLEAVDS